MTRLLWIVKHLSLMQKKRRDPMTLSSQQSHLQSWYIFLKVLLVCIHMLVMTTCAHQVVRLVQADSKCWQETTLLYGNPVMAIESVPWANYFCFGCFWSFELDAICSSTRRITRISYRCHYISRNRWIHCSTPQIMSLVGQCSCCVWYITRISWWWCKYDYIHHDAHLTWCGK